MANVSGIYSMLLYTICVVLSVVLSIGDKDTHSLNIEETRRAHYFRKNIGDNEDTLSECTGGHTDNILNDNPRGVRFVDV